MNRIRLLKIWTAAGLSALVIGYSFFCELGCSSNKKKESTSQVESEQRKPYESDPRLLGSLVNCYGYDHFSCMPNSIQAYERMLDQYSLEDDSLDYSNMVKNNIRLTPERIDDRVMQYAIKNANQIDYSTTRSEIKITFDEAHTQLGYKVKEIREATTQEQKYALLYDFVIGEGTDTLRYFLRRNLGEKALFIQGYYDDGRIIINVISASIVVGGGAPYPTP